jgi:hypothetical protein
MQRYETLPALVRTFEARSSADSESQTSMILSRRWLEGTVNTKDDYDTGVDI